MNDPMNIDNLLKKLNKDASRELFAEFIRGLSLVQVDTKRGAGIHFGRHAGSKAGELEYSSKCFWLRTLPLDKQECFIALHRESGFYRKGRTARYSADLLGIWRSQNTTRLAVAELKQGAKGDSLAYAVAEGLRNLYLAINARKELCNWWAKTCPEEFKGYVKNYNPFTELSKEGKDAQLLILGDRAWIDARVRGKEQFLGKKPIAIGNTMIEVSVYSFSHNGTPRSAPHALLPLKMIL